MCLFFIVLFFIVLLFCGFVGCGWWGDGGSVWRRSVCYGEESINLVGKGVVRGVFSLIRVVNYLGCILCLVLG